MRYIGHLDTMRFFQKAIRRAQIDIAYSEGFSPHQIMSFAYPLGVGMESDAEYFDIEVRTFTDAEDVRSRLDLVTGEDVSILSVRMLPERAENCMSAVIGADYMIGCKKGYDHTLLPKDRKLWEEALSSFMARETVIVEKSTKKGTQMTDIRPFIIECRLCDAVETDAFSSEDIMDTECPVLFLKACAGSRANLKPGLFMQTFLDYAGWEAEELGIAVTRKELYALSGETWIPLEDVGTE